MQGKKFINTYCMPSSYTVSVKQLPMYTAINYEGDKFSPGCNVNIVCVIVSIYLPYIHTSQLQCVNAYKCVFDYICYIPLINLANFFAIK